MCLLGLFWGGRTLQIMKAKVSDGGKYSCVAMNAAGEAHRHIYLTVFSKSTATVCTQSVWPWDKRWIFLCPLPFSSSQYQGQQRGFSCGGEHPSWEIINSGVWNHCCTSSQHHLVQERQIGNRISQPAHPEGGTDAWNQNHGGKAQKLHVAAITNYLLFLMI